MKTSDLKAVVTSDVNERDGIGIEFYFDDNLMIEIFRNDSEKSKMVTIYDKSISLEIVEYAVGKFKSEIPSAFIDE